MNKKQHQKFNKEIDDFLKDKYKVKEDNHYMLETKCGNLNIILDNYFRNKKLYSIFCRFDDVEKAREYGGRSGKYNFYSSDSEYLMSDFKSFINNIII
jgi:hypothetical protein